MSIFNSNVERVASDDRNVQVSTLWGSTTVIVPDGVRVDPGGFMPFGSTICEDECLTGEGPEVHVRSFGAFGSVEILTQSQYAAEQPRD